MLLDVPAGAVAEATELWLAAASRQALRAPLPYGWSPTYVVELDTTAGEYVGFASPATLTVPNVHGLGVSTEVVVARFDEAETAWRAIGLATLSYDEASHRAAVDGIGQVAFLVADTAPFAPGEAVTGELLPGVDPLNVPSSGYGDGMTASLSLSPDTVLADGISQAEVRFADKALTSGTPLQADLSESLTLANEAEEVVSFPGYTADLSAYNLPEASDDLRSRFLVTPANAAAVAVFKQGEVAVRVTDFPEVASGTLLSPDDTVDRPVSADGVMLTVRPGSVTEVTPAEIQRLTESDLSLPVPAGFEVLAAADLRFGGRPLLQGAHRPA